MVHRKVVPLIAGAALVLPITLLGAFGSSVEPASVPVPAAAVAASTPEVLVEWIIRIDDLVACRTASPDLRRMQHEYASRVHFVTYAIGADTVLVRSFLRRERLARAEVRPMTEREFERTLARQLGSHGRPPALLVTTGGTRVAFDAGTRDASGQSGVDGFSTYLGTLLRPGLLLDSHRSQSASGGR